MTQHEESTVEVVQTTARELARKFGREYWRERDRSY
jgi:hypothetical protein